MRASPGCGAAARIADRRVRSTRHRPLSHQIETLPFADEAKIDALTRAPDLVDTLKQLEQHPYAEQQALDTDYSSAQDVCHKLSQLLPLDPLVKQSLLETDSTDEKIDRLRHLIQRIQN